MFKVILPLALVAILAEAFIAHEDRKYIYENNLKDTSTGDSNESKLYLGYDKEGKTVVSKKYFKPPPGEKLYVVKRIASESVTRASDVSTRNWSKVLRKLEKNYYAVQSNEQDVTTVQTKSESDKTAEFSEEVLTNHSDKTSNDTSDGMEMAKRWFPMLLKKVIDSTIPNGTLNELVAQMVCRKSADSVEHFAEEIYSGETSVKRKRSNCRYDRRRQECNCQPHIVNVFNDSHFGCLLLGNSSGVHCNADTLSDLNACCSWQMRPIKKPCSRTKYDSCWSNVGVNRQPIDHINSDFRQYVKNCPAIVATTGRPLNPILPPPYYPPPPAPLAIRQPNHPVPYPRSKPFPRAAHYAPNHYPERVILPEKPYTHQLQPVEFAKHGDEPVRFHFDNPSAEIIDFRQGPQYLHKHTPFKRNPSKDTEHWGYGQLETTAPGQSEETMRLVIDLPSSFQTQDVHPERDARTFDKLGLVKKTERDSVVKPIAFNRAPAEQIDRSKSKPAAAIESVEKPVKRKNIASKTFRF